MEAAQLRINTLALNSGSLDSSVLSSPTSPWCPVSYGEDESVVIQDSPTGHKEIYISCVDALGLGVLVARLILDYGLRIISGDFSTDGRYCFLMYKVEHAHCDSRDSYVDWDALKTGLERLCPSHPSSALNYRTKFKGKVEEPALKRVMVECKNRIGLINHLIKMFWSHGMTIHRLKCITTKEDNAQDEFYVSDSQFSGSMQKLEDLCKSIRKVLDATVTHSDVFDVSDSSIRKNRSQHMDQIQCSHAYCIPKTNSSSLLDLLHASNLHSGAKSYCKVSVEIDNCTSSIYTIVRCTCPDRKGILYDFFRLTSIVSLRASYGRIATSKSMCECLIFIKDSRTGGQIYDKELQSKLKTLVYSAIAKPLELQLTTSNCDEKCLELKVIAPVDIIGRGRPRVMYDVTVALSKIGISVCNAEMYVKNACNGSMEVLQELEVHLFLIQSEDGKPIQSTKLRTEIYERVFFQLMGISKGSPGSYKYKPKRKCRYCCFAKERQHHKKA